RPVRDTLPVRQRAPLPPVDQVRIRVDGLRELVDEAALADPRDAYERHQLRRALLSRTDECTGHELDLALPPYERRAGLGDVDAEARPSLAGLPDRHRLGLPFRRDGLGFHVGD